VPFMKYVKKKYGSAREVTDDNIIQRMRFACQITKASMNHNNTFFSAKAPQCYVIH
jgi:hypothetical protein